MIMQTHPMSFRTQCKSARLNAEDVRVKIVRDCKESNSAHAFKYCSLHPQLEAQ